MKKIDELALVLNELKLTTFAEKYEEICKSNEIEFISQKLNSNIGNFYKFTIISPKEKVIPRVNIKIDEDNRLVLFKIIFNLLPKLELYPITV